jgi:hypothetical protein
MRIRYQTICEPSAPVVAAKITEVLTIVLQNIQVAPSSDEWQSLLPPWLVRQFAPATTADAKQQWLAHWRHLPDDEKVQLAKEQPWELLEWLHWFEEDNSCWTLASTTVVDLVCLELELDVDGWPIANGALQWLVRASGGGECCEI